MGEKLLHYYKNNIKKEYKIAFFSTFLIGLLIHFYKFTNTLPNHDSLYNFYSDQNVLGSGRWALSLSCGISSYYDLPWIIGLLSCVYIALTAVVIVALFKVKNPVVIGLTGGILAASPSTTETFFFLFTADGYMLAMLLSALAVYLSRVDEHRISRTILSGICVCVSCGIYQAYVSFALILALCYFMDILLHNSFSKKECLRWAGKQILIYSISLAAYYVIWQLAMRIEGIQANNYQGISEVGTITPGLLLNGLISSVRTTLFYFLQWNVLEHGFSLYSVLSILLLLAFVGGVVAAFIKSRIFQRKWAVVLFVLCLLAFVPFACIWNFVSETVGYRAMMLQCLNLVLLFTMLLYERWTKPSAKNAVGMLLGVILFNNALMANISYFYLNLSYERTYAEGIEMMHDIREIQSSTDVEDIVIIGSKLEQVQWAVDGDVASTIPAEKIHMLSFLIETNLMFDQEHVLPFLHNNFGLQLPHASDEEKNRLVETELVEDMPCWPARGSVAEVDGTIVIKLAEEGK